MPDDVSLSRFSFRRQFPAVRLLEAATIALAPASLLLATVASLLLSGSDWLIDRTLRLDNSLPVTSSIAEIWSLSPRFVSNDAHVAMNAFLRPWSSVMHPMISFLGHSQGLNGWLRAGIQLFFGIGLWSVVGTILCRRSATRFVGNDHSTIRDATHFGLGRWSAAASAPLIPFFSAFLLGLIVASIGLIGRLPWLGSIWLIVMSPVITVLGFAIAFLLLATILGWPLMVASVATDDCDSFGGLSRAYSGLTNRPWHALAFIIIGLIVGVLLMSFVNFIAVTTIWCGISCVVIGSGTDRAEESLLSPITSLVGIVVSGVGISYFWSMVTVVSLLLRQEVDGVPLDQLAVDDARRPVREPLPVVGIPATDARTE